MQVIFSIILMAAAVGAMIDLDSENMKRAAQFVFIFSALWFKYAPTD